MKATLTVTVMCFAVLAAGCKKTSVRHTPVWNEYLQARATGAKLPFADFSYAGYGYGAKAIPEAQGAVFDVTRFGAIPDDDVGDRAAIEAAITAATENGGGIIFFPPGRFLVNESPGRRKGIEIRASGIVLRGSGAGPDGTTIFMRYPMEPANPEQLWSVPPMFYFTALESPSSSRNLTGFGTNAKTMLSGNAAKGDLALTVVDPDQFSAGKVIALVNEGPQLNEYYLQGLEPRFNWARINETGVAVSEKHTIVSVKGNVLELAAPLLTDARVSDGWQVVEYPVIRNCGFEDIHFEGNFLEPFVHHKNTVHDSGYTAVIMEACLDSWIRRCRFSNVSTAATLRGSLASSCVLNQTDGNGGHNAFSITFGTYNLVGLCRDLAGEFHGAGISHLAAGNVVWRYEAEVERGGPDFHGTFPRESLHDVCVVSSRDSHGGNFKDLPNHLGGLVFWNLKHTGERETEVDFWDLLPGQQDRPYGPMTVVNPTIVGFHGSSTTFAETAGTRIEQLGTAVLPESLYEAQHEIRSGRVPEWVGDLRREWQLIKADWGG